jgi:acyl-CoA thioesterase-2
MSSAVDDLLAILDLEQLEHNLFRGRSPQVGWQRVFGGQVIGQALVAATRTVEDGGAGPGPARQPHSMHAYFLLEGDPSVPILYEVERIRDGGSFSTRRVVAIQHGKAIFFTSVSFQAPEEGFTHQFAMPDVPMPEDLPGEKDIVAKYLEHMPGPMKAYFASERPIEVRPVDLSLYMGLSPQPPHRSVWIRAAGTLPDDAGLHHCVLAYASDMTLLDTALVPHGKSIFSKEILAASLDHALWMHRPFRADDWLLYVQDSPFSGNGRGFTRGLIYNRKGELVASVAQEGLIRRRREKPDSA